MDFKSQLNQWQTQLNQLVDKIKAWPQYMQIGAGIIALGILLFLIGIILY